MTIKKRSYGIACCRYNINLKKMEILMIRKRCTYYFMEFAYGRYSPNDDNRLLFLMNRMSAEEKIIIESLDFDKIWYQIWLNNKEKNYRLYLKYKKIFENTFLKNHKNLKYFQPGERLKRLLSNSVNQDSLWEIPKGRKNSPQELELNCAVREFWEETGFLPHNYTLLMDIEPLTINYTNEKANYIHKYFVAIETHSYPVTRTYKNIALNFQNKNQLSEILDIKWITLDELRHIDYTKRFLKLTEKIFKILKKRYQLSKITEFKHFIKNN